MYAETARLVIRDPHPEDWRGTHTFLSDPDVMQWLHLGPEPYTEAQSRQWVNNLMFHNHQVPRTSHNSVIVHALSQQVIGWIGVGVPSSHWEHIGELDFGYALARSYWSHGYMTEALRGLFRFAFTDLNTNSLFATCDVRNHGSVRVMQKVGMHLYDRFHDTDSAHGPLEIYLFTLSREQWSALPLE